MNLSQNRFGFGAAECERLGKQGFDFTDVT